MIPKPLLFHEGEKSVMLAARSAEENIQSPQELPMQESPLVRGVRNDRGKAAGEGSLVRLQLLNINLLKGSQRGQVYFENNKALFAQIPLMAGVHWHGWVNQY